MKKTTAALALILAVLAAYPAAAQSDSDFETREENGGLTITKYKGWDGPITIPARIGGKPVRAIGDEAFARSKLTSVSIPEGVVSIGRGPSGITRLRAWSYRGAPPR